MLQNVLRLGLWILLGSSVLLLLTRVGAYDGAYFETLRSSLRSDPGCPAPCFMSIQPGQTPAREATYILEAHPWVGSIRVPESFITLNAGEGVGHHRAPEITWTWNGTQPGFMIDTAIMQTNPQRYVVNWLTMPSSISLAEIWMAFGPPLAATQNAFTQTLIYPQFQIRSATQCSRFWDEATEIIIAGPNYNASEDQARGLRRMACARLAGSP